MTSRHKQFMNGLYAVVITAGVVVPFVVSAASSGAPPLVTCTGAAGSNPCNFAAAMAMAQHIMSFLIFYMAAPLAALSFAYAGFLWLTAGGNEEQAKKALGVFRYVIIGFVLVLAAWLIVYTIVSSIANPNFNFKQFLGAP